MLRNPVLPCDTVTLSSSIELRVDISVSECFSSLFAFVGIITHCCVFVCCMSLTGIS